MEMTYSLQQLSQTAQAFWKIAGNTRVIAFYGNIGSGKTTFIRALCKARNVNDVVSSPTFSIINEYFFTSKRKQQKIFHIDLYRVKDELEAKQAGVEDCLYSDHICLIEWPEKIVSLLPGDTLHVFIQLVDTQIRKLRIGDN